jgi:hypothetical protein
MDEIGNEFSKNVFVNCPFDEEYKPLLRSLLFTIIYCGLTPRIASEKADSSEVRVTKIVTIIKESMYSIHDLSRIDPIYKDNLPRFNMPFELGIDIGCKESSDGLLSRKRCLIFEKEKYRYQKVLSDLSGNDIKYHNSNPEDIVRELRNWLVECHQPNLPSGSQVWDAYNEFCYKFDSETKRLNFKKRDIDNMPIAEFIYFIHLLYKPFEIS